MNNRAAFLATTAFVAIAAASSASWAQTATSPRIDEVVVTAQKRAENVQDIPKQVQVVTTEVLKQSNITNLTDLRKLVPSISGTGNSIRGVATAASTISANSKVGTVLDDIPIPTRAASVNNLLDISQVEVLPGPQGTLAGRNATGGLINLVTRKPSRTSMVALAQATYTTDHEINGGVYLSGPINDKFAFSISSNFQHFRGLKRNIKDGNWSWNENEGVRAKLLWAPDEKSEITATYAYLHDQNRDATSQLVFAYIAVPLTSITSSLDVRVPKRNFTQFFPGVTPSADNRSFYSEFQARQHRISQTGILRYERDFKEGTFTAVTSILKETAPQLQSTNTYELSDMNIRPEYDGYAHVGNSTDYKTLELRFASKNTGKLTYLVGSFFSENKNGYDYVRYYQPVNWNRVFGQSNGAAYGSASYLFDTGTTVRAGLRYEKDKIDYRWVFNSIQAVTKVSENGKVISFPKSNDYRLSTGNSSADFINYDLGLQQKFGENVMAYVTYGVADQGPIYDAEDNTVAIVRDLTPVESEKVKSIEYGIKSQWLDRRLTVNINAFDSKYENYQASTNVPDPLNPNSVPVLKLHSVGQVETKGVELAVSALIGAGLRISVNGLFDDAKIEKWLYAPCYARQTAYFGCVSMVVPGEVIARPVQRDLSGKNLASAPKVKLTTSVSYEHALEFIPDVRYRAGAIVRYATKQNTDILGDPAKDLPATTYVDANISFTKDNYELAFFVNNLFEEFAETFSTGMAPGITNYPRLDNGQYQVKARDLDRNNFRYFGVTVKAHY